MGNTHSGKPGKPDFWKILIPDSYRLNLRSRRSQKSVNFEIPNQQRLRYS
jgi:hypothetical protein